jgi:hypothetical protein
MALLLDKSRIDGRIGRMIVPGEDWEKPATVPFCPPQTPRKRTWPYAVGCRLLLASVTERSRRVRSWSATQNEKFERLTRRGCIRHRYLLKLKILNLERNGKTKRIVGMSSVVYSNANCLWVGGGGGAEPKNCHIQRVTFLGLFCAEDGGTALRRRCSNCLPKLQFRL